MVWQYVIAFLGIMIALKAFEGLLGGLDIAFDAVGGLVKGVIALPAGFIGFTLGVLCIGGVIGWLLTASGVL